MGFLDSFLGGKKEVSVATGAFQPLVDAMVDVLGPEITGARDFEPKITSALTMATRYLDEQVGRIPGILSIAAGSYATDPYLRAVFPDVADIPAALGRSVEVRDALPERAKQGSARVCALMGVRHRDRLQAQPSEHIVFADHTLACIAPDEASARTAIRDAACRRIFKMYHEHLEKLRHKGKLLPEDWNIENVTLQDDGHAKARHMIFDDYVYAEKELTPDNLLRGLVAWLERPFDQFRLTEGSQMVMAGAANGQGTSRIEVPTIVIADRRRWMAILVEFSVSEGMAALNQEPRSHRYIVI